MNGSTRTKPADHPPSVWAATANAQPELPVLSNDIETEVVIVGGGYSGLSTAHHLRMAGIGCVVLEANHVGWGASGRNGGMAVLRYKKPYSTLAAEYGDDVAQRLYSMVLEAVDTMAAIVDEYRIDCGFARYGHITAASGDKAMRTLEADIRWLRTQMKDSGPSVLDRDRMRELVGTSVYPGGYIDPRAAGIHPLNYARGLAAGLAHIGVPIYVGGAVTAIRAESSGMIVQTPGGTVRGGKVVITTNAYTDLESLGVNLSRRIVPVSSSVIATAPLPDAVAASILPKGHLVTDTRNLVNYFRKLPGNRVLFGGRGSMSGLESPGIYRGLEQQLVDIFPALAGLPIEHRWSGKVAVTLDDFPHVGRVGDRIFYAMGCGGRGVALTNLLGKLMARMVKGENVDAGPISSNRFAPIPFHAFRLPAMQVMSGYYKLLDRLER